MNIPSHSKKPEPLKVFKEWFENHSIKSILEALEKALQHHKQKQEDAKQNPEDKSALISAAREYNSVTMNYNSVKGLLEKHAVDLDKIENLLNQRLNKIFYLEANRDFKLLKTTLEKAELYISQQELKTFIAHCEDEAKKGLFEPLSKALNACDEIKKYRELHPTGTSIEIKIEKESYSWFKKDAIQLLENLKKLEINIHSVIHLLERYPSDKKDPLYKKAKAYSKLWATIPSKYMELLRSMPETYSELISSGNTHLFKTLSEALDDYLKAKLPSNFCDYNAEKKEYYYLDDYLNKKLPVTFCNYDGEKKAYYYFQISLIKLLTDLENRGVPTNKISSLLDQEPSKEDPLFQEAQEYSNDLESLAENSPRP